MCDAEGLERRVLAGVGNPARISSIHEAAEGLRHLLEDCDAVNPHNFPASVWVHAARDAFDGRRVFYSCHEPPRHLYEREMDAHYVASPSCTRSWLTREFDALAGTRWRRLDQEAMRGYEVVFTNSTYTARKIREIYGREAVATWFGAPEPGPVVSPSGAREAGVLRVLSVSRLTPMKNVRACVEAMARLGAQARITLRVVGEGDRRSELERLAMTAGVAACVQFLGGLSEAALEEEFQAADAVLYVPYDEPMGLVPMEAALRGIPCVASDHGGPAEILAHGESGLLVHPHCPQEIADALLALRDDVALRERLSQAARRKVEGLSFSRYAGLLDRVLQGRPPEEP